MYPENTLCIGNHGINATQMALAFHFMHDLLCLNVRLFAFTAQFCHPQFGDPSETQAGWYGPLLSAFKIVCLGFICAWNLMSFKTQRRTINKSIVFWTWEVISITRNSNAVCNNQVVQLGARENCKCPKNYHKYKLPGSNPETVESYLKGFWSS